MAATTTRPERPFNPVSNSTSLLRFLPLTILCCCLIYLFCFYKQQRTKMKPNIKSSYKSFLYLVNLLNDTMSEIII